jgi:hypothetical protein
VAYFCANAFSKVLTEASQLLQKWVAYFWHIFVDSASAKSNKRFMPCKQHNA